MEINGTQIILEQCEYDALIAENVALKARVKELEELAKRISVVFDMKNLTFFLHACALNKKCLLRPTPY